MTIANVGIKKEQKEQIFAILCVGGLNEYRSVNGFVQEAVDKLIRKHLDSK